MYLRDVRFHPETHVREWPSLTGRASDTGRHVHFGASKVVCLRNQNQNRRDDSRCQIARQLFKPTKARSNSNCSRTTHRKPQRTFALLAEKGFYDGVIFHRVINGFMIQGGDPTEPAAVVQSAWGGRFNDEIDPSSEVYRRGYKAGTVAMANAGPNTNGSQFFIMHVDYPLPPSYTIFGRVTEGQDVVNDIATSKTSAG